MSTDKDKSVKEPVTPNRSGKLRTCETDYNLARHIIPFLQESAFYAEISRHIDKRFTKDLPTLAVEFEPKSEEIVMWVNPDFMEKQSHSQTVGAIEHEYSHIVFGHLGARRREPHGDWNIGTDLAINSLIDRNSKKKRSVDMSSDSKEHMPLPECALIPGKRPFLDPETFDKLSKERKKAATALADLIETLPPLKSSEFYFNKVLQDAEKNGYSTPDIEFIIGSMDDHGGWDETPDDMKEYIEGKIKSIIEKAVQHADSQSDGWGNIPADLREEIRKSVSSVVNWRNVLRQFVGMLVRGNKTTSMKRINRRYPYIHPGHKRGYTAKLLIAIDESGSVGNEMLEMFFAELEQLTRKVDITLLHFDCSCSMGDIYEWKKGMRPKLNRIKTGGTNFDAPTKIVNDPKNRGRWDGMLIMTDGQAPAPGPSRIKRGWILGQGCNLYFKSDEIQVFLSKERPMSGAWR